MIPQKPEQVRKICNREKYEWCNIWWEAANEDALPRVLLIGDSITVGYRPLVQEQLKDKAYIDQFASSQAIDDPALRHELIHMLSEYSYHVIHFNNGLHGWHVSEEEYRRGLEQIIGLIREKQPSAKLLLATSTPMTEKGFPSRINREKDILITERNRTVAFMADRYSLKINDLYGLIAGNSEVRSDDGGHYKSEGLAILAGQTTTLISECLEGINEVIQ